MTSLKSAFEKKRVEPLEVSYLIHKLSSKEKTDQNLPDTIEKIAACMNVQLRFENLPQKNSKSADIPFIAPDDYDSIKNDNDKVVIFGPSGCGKSRAAFEILIEDVQNFDRIIIINPRAPSWKGTTARARGYDESSRLPLVDLLDKLRTNDVVVWDNFPDDIAMERDVTDLQKVLQILSFKNVAKMLIVLKPKYLEIYKLLLANNRKTSATRVEIPSYELDYSRENTKALVKTVGSAIPSLRKLYETYVRRDVDSIATILWKKEPIPLIVLNYYQQLIFKVMSSVKSNKSEILYYHQQEHPPRHPPRQQYEKAEEDEGNDTGIDINAVMEAENLRPSSSYYKHQVEIITSFDERQIDAEFLYTLKLCYEIGLPRRKHVIDWLQRGIFGSHLNNPFPSLGTWLYLLGHQYSIHDAFKDAIEMPEFVRMIVVKYLVDKFEYLINSYYGDYDKGHSDDNSALYHLANFMGRNVHLLNWEEEKKNNEQLRQQHANRQEQQQQRQKQFPPDRIYDYMKRNRHFETGLGLGVGQVFAYLISETQQQIMQRTELDVEFTKGLCYGLGNNFLHLDTSNQLSIFERMKHNILFSRFLGENLGRMLFSELQDRHLQDLILSKLIRENGQFADGIGMGLGYQLASTTALLFPTSNDNNKNLQKKKRRIYKLMKEYGELTRGVGYGLAVNFGSLDKKLQNWMWRRADIDDEFAKGVGVGFAYVFNQLSPDFQEYLLKNKNYTNPKFAFGFGIYMGYFFTELPKSLQEQIFEETIEKNSEFACGLAIGLTFIFNFLHREFQQKIFDKIKSNVRFACGLGVGFGWFYKQLPVDLQQRALNCICEENSEFAFGFGWGMVYLMFHFDKELQDQIFKKAGENIHFAHGLGFSLGVTHASQNEYFPKELKHTIYHKLCEENSELASGVGLGLGYAFNYISNKIRAEVFEKAEKNSELAFGLGKGLGYIFNYFSKDTQKDILVGRAAQKLGSRFMNGLGTGLGYTFCYLSEDDDDRRKKELLYKATRDNPYLASGLGQGLGYMYQYLPGNLKEEVFEKISQDAQFSRGLGEGLGGIFVYLSQDTKEELLEELVAVGYHVEFARGLGVGLGRIFGLLHKDLQSRVLRISNEHNTALARGLGEGMALYFEYRQQEGRRGSREEEVVEQRGEEDNAVIYRHYNINDDIYRYARENVQFDIGLGEGLGMIFQYLPLEFQDKLLSKSEHQYDDEYFARGLGEGLGRIFQYLNKDLQEIVFERTATTTTTTTTNSNNNNSAFSRGLGAGLSQAYFYPILKSKSNYIVNKMIKKYIDDNSEFVLGFGLGAGEIFTKLPTKSQNRIIQQAKINQGFAKGLGFSLGHAFAYLEKNDESVMEELYRELLYKNEQFAHSFGSGIGQNFGAFEQGPQEQAISLLVKGVSGSISSAISSTTATTNATTGYAKGLGSSLGLFFRYLNWSSRLSILTRSLNYNRWFDSSLGSSIGRSFASFDPSLQDIILQKAMPKHNKEFARGFGYGLRDSLNYIDKQRREKILSSFVKSNQYLLEGFNKPYLIKGAKNSNKTTHDTVLAYRDDNNLPFSDFPLVRFTPPPHPLHASDSITSNYDEHTSKSGEVSFSGQVTDYCICYVDMVSSTTITYGLNSMQMGKYYSIFLNSMSTVISKFQGKIVKNVGDCLIFYFPKTAMKERRRNDPSINSRQEFKNAIECCLAMVESHEIINARLSDEKLPPLNYKISADYGPVELVQSQTSKSYDLFGPVMNICAKINSKAPANGIAIGSGLYQNLKSFKIEDYIYKMIGKFHFEADALQGKRTIYKIYSIMRANKKMISNSFVNL